MDTNNDVQKYAMYWSVTVKLVNFWEGGFVKRGKLLHLLYLLAKLVLGSSIISDTTDWGYRLYYIVCVL